MSPWGEEQWTAPLQAMGKELESLAGSTETEFLSIGSKLQDFHLNAREMSNMTASVVNLMAGDEMTGAVDGLVHILERVRALGNESVHGKDILSEILDILDRIHDPLCGFTRIVRSLGVLYVAIKVESVRLGEDDPGFITLAEDIRKLAWEIDAKSSAILAQTTSLISPIKQTLARVLDIEAAQREESLVILQSSATNLGILTQKHEASSTVMRRIADQYNAVTRNIGEVVQSLQFHDITRQRIEHVKSCLDELIPDLRGLALGGNGCKPPEALSVIRTTGDICELQTAQLRHAGAELAGAVGNIVGSLRGIAENVAGMSEATREVVGVASEAGSSFGEEMERGLSPVALALGKYAEGNRELTEAISSVLGVVGEMAAYVKDIEKIEIQIRLIALNAIVKASHIEEKGAPIGVLAGEIHQLAIDTHGQVATLSASLKLIIAAAGELSDGIEKEVDPGEAELGRLMQELKDLIEGLRRLHEDSVSALMRAEDAGRSLADEIEGFAAQIAVHDKFEREIAEVLAKLDTIVARSRALAPFTSDSDKAESLKALEGRYTMHSERSVHQAVAAVTVPGAPENPMAARQEATPANGGELEAVEEDLGDNVELF